MSDHKILLSSSGFWVVESLPHRGAEADDVFPSYDHGRLECFTRNLAMVRANGTAGDRMTWNGKPGGTYESYYTYEIERLKETLSRTRD